jgi:3D (Asp-Asp-Asp) domain-containing protein
MPSTHERALPRVGAAALFAIGGLVLQTHEDHPVIEVPFEQKISAAPATTPEPFPPRNTYPERASRSDREVPVTVSTTTTAPKEISLGSFTVTCYSLRGLTRSETRVAPGTIAVDPDVIPLGTKLKVDGYGYGTALDTGSAIQNRRLDIWKSSRQACLNWGKKVVQVWRVEQ